jgi:uncharacterized protein
MSKADAKPTQSLEEILTSIRKALAEEEVQGGADSPAPAEVAAPSAKQAAPTKSDPLSGQLAVALNGSGSHGAPTDDDLSDLLAPVSSKAEPPAELEPSPPPAGDKKDPLWFLAPKPAEESEAGQEEKPSEAASKTGPIPEPEITLTRPEVLRSSLPPLFGADEATDVKAEPANFVKPAPEKRASFFSVGAPEKGKDEKRETKAPVTEKVPKPEAKSSEPLPTQSQPSGMLKPPAPASPTAEVTASTPARPGAKEAPAAPADSRALEGVIGQMLEPLIKSWLEANLPRLVEKVVREEVARTAVAKPDPAKS